MSTDTLTTLSATAEEAAARAPADVVVAPRETFRGVLKEMVTELYQYRELLGQMVLRDLRLRYKQAVMGFGWAMFMPMLIVSSGLLVKYAMAQMSGDSLDAFSVSGMSIKALAWAFFVGALGFAVSSLVGNAGLVTKIYFPREVFPLSAVITQSVDSAVGAVMLALVLFGYVGISLSPALLWAFPLIVMLICLTAGACLLFSCLNVFFRDVKYIVQVLLTFGIFFTPVFYDPQFFGPTGAWLMMLNPLSPLLEGLRLSIVEHQNLLATLVVERSSGVVVVWQPWYLAYAALWSIGGLMGSWWLFHKLEFVYAEYV